MNMKFKDYLLFMKTKYYLSIIGVSCWSGLGFIRGVNSYKYEHNKWEAEKPLLYSSLVGHGIVGVIFYVHPILLPFNIYKEIYRLEINIRDLENEKKSRFYNELF